MLVSTSTAARSCFINQTDCDLGEVTLKNRRLAASNSRWQVYYDHLADARGNEVPDYLVIAGSQAAANKVTGVAILPVIGDKLLLMRMYRHPIGRQLWEGPGGFIDQGETAAEAALRELTEETGLRCAPGDLIALGTYAPEPATMACFGALFAAMRCEGTPRVAHDEIGLGELSVFDRSEIDRLIAAGEIAHAG